ncbi:heavy-metal-associated domain-containing protein [Agriterribacter sp.]|uniref:heavy-metal-associated domain-containing protein n=1 Tax=Agriterribacter sp. TaxID=2821509 RepID=UPI002C81F2E3|nr:heavy-metal-associated domain-containing protein [Agriterribacter sp.]HRO47234.1 heavy-metal-associated domain-containing protein [Agriterribacter sp.]HRQ19469.1 heavy-metal-associated domain-containing protein [Agriterribacter sp.]
MKKFALLVTLICGVAWSAVAQPKKPVTVKIATPTVQCEQCKKNIENYMKHEDGIAKVNVNYKRKETTITYLPDRTNIENVKTGIANAGYDAGDVKANEDSYKALPTCCKKPEDQ